MRKFPSFPDWELSHWSRMSRCPMKTILNDRALKALKATSVRVELSDAECKGLTFRCTPAGVKSWTFAYRVRFLNKDGEWESKMRRMTLGEYPALGLAAARGAADERRKQLKGGTDPTAQRDRERVEQ